MKLVKQIQAQLKIVTDQYSVDFQRLSEQAYNAFKEVMGEDALQTKIKAMIIALESSKELTQVENDEYFARWTRVDFSNLIDLKDSFQKELLERYFQDEHCANLNFKDSVLTTSEGPAIVINEDGDVYDQDSGKFIVHKGNYETDVERNALIEAWMEKAGYFPSVIRCDHYGNAFYVNTKAKEEKAS
jgi:hypothetical protein